MDYRDSRLPLSLRLQCAFEHATKPEHVRRAGLEYATMLDTQLGALRLMYEACPALPEEFACAVLLYPVMADLPLPENTWGAATFNYMRKLASAKPPGAAGPAFAQETDPLVKTFILAASLASLENLSYTLKTGKAPDSQRPVILWAAEILDEDLEPDDLAVFSPDDIELYAGAAEGARALASACRGVSATLETRLTAAADDVLAFLEWESHRSPAGPAAPGSKPS